MACLGGAGANGLVQHPLPSSGYGVRAIASTRRHYGKRVGRRG